MKVTLPPELEQFIAEQLKSGCYRSADDVVAQSLGMLRAQEEFVTAHTAELREKVNEGMESMRRGELVDGPAAIQSLRKKLKRIIRGEE